MSCEIRMQRKGRAGGRKDVDSRRRVIMVRAGGEK